MFKPCAKLACVVAVVLSGCGGPVEEPAPELLESGEQSIIWACGVDRQFTRVWKVDDVEVGREYCECDGTYHSFGDLLGNYSYPFLAICRP